MTVHVQLTVGNGSKRCPITSNTNRIRKEDMNPTN